MRGPEIYNKPNQLAGFSIEPANDVLRVKAWGHWSLSEVGELDEAFSSYVEDKPYHAVEYDLSDVEKLDTAGAYILARAIRCETGKCFQWNLSGNDNGQKVLIEAAEKAALGRPPRRIRAWYDMFSRIGVATTRFGMEAYDTLVFFGCFMVVLVKLLFQPHKIRWKSVVAMTEDVGLNALPIVMLLCFFIGAVIAYMGANLLAVIGFQIYMVELVGFSMLRELAGLITAILLAGRSDSAFTAQIGAMKMRQEIDAMQVIGVDPYEALVVPRALACLISMPILTFFAMMSGVFGGMIVAWLGPTDISPILFLTRLQDTVGIQHFWVGMIKAPFYAIIIAVIGCRQGLAVSGSVDSLGNRTTSSVVQAIFTVITIDAAFAMLFLEMGL